MPQKQPDTSKLADLFLSLSVIHILPNFQTETCDFDTFHSTKQKKKLPCNPRVLKPQIYLQFSNGHN